jgi:hypothetical protein
MNRTLAIITAAAFVSAPQVSAAADPVVVSYDEAVTCAALDRVIAISLAIDNPSATAEDKQTAEYLIGMSDKWLAQATMANPDGKDATEREVVDRYNAILAKLDDETGTKQVETDMAQCAQLEEAAYGGPNGLVD